MDQDAVKRLANQHQSHAEQRADVAKLQEEELERRSATFDQQISRVWNGLAQECRSFVDAYNRGRGLQHLHIFVDPDNIEIEATRVEDTVLTIRLDRRARKASSELVIRKIRSVRPFAIRIGDTLMLLYYEEVISQEDLAMKLLTELTNAISAPGR